MILIVTYDLSLASSHAAFFEALKQQGAWWHYLTSTWLISTNKNPTEVYNALTPFIVPADRILIFELGTAHQGWLPKEAWDWIKQQQTTVVPRVLAPPLPANPLSLSNILTPEALSKVLGITAPKVAPQRVTKTRAETLADLMKPKK